MSFSTSVSLVVKAPLERVWEALTKPEIVKEYFFGTDLVTDWTVGSPIYFRGEWQGKTYEDRGTVLAFAPRKHLAYDYWSSLGGTEDKPEARQLLEFDVEDTGDGIRVSVKQSNVDTQARADHSASNWRGVLEGMRSLLEQQS